MVHENSMFAFMKTSPIHYENSNFQNTISNKSNTFRDVFNAVTTKNVHSKQNRSENRENRISSKKELKKGFYARKELMVKGLSKKNEPDVVEMEKNIKQKRKTVESQVPNEQIADAMTWLSQLIGIDFEHILEILQRQNQAVRENDFISSIEAALVEVQENTQIALSDKVNIADNILNMLKQLDMFIQQEGKELESEIGNILRLLQQQTEGTKQKLSDTDTVSDYAQSKDGRTIYQGRLDEMIPKDNIHSKEGGIMNGDTMEQSLDLREMSKNSKPSAIRHDTSTESESEAKDADLSAKMKIISIQTRKTDAHQPHLPFQQTLEPVLDQKEIVNIAEAAKKSFAIPGVSKDNIIKQVVDSAKVIIGDDKSEMIIQLKPQNLGKLSLEIVADRGVMVARFITENQQVKEIIESSLPQLKEALESQGLNVGGFSVSVGNGGPQREAYAKSNSLKTQKVLRNTNRGNVTVITDYVSDQRILNPYQISDSSIDYIA